MTVKVKRKLLEQQSKLMQERTEWETMQTDFNYDEDFYKFCEYKMQLLDEETEQIRHILEMGCCE